MHLSDRVLRQYGYMQTISHPPPLQDMTAFNAVNAHWVHFSDNVVTVLIPSVGPHACSEDYIAWYTHVSHPYVIRCDEEAGRRSRSRSRSHSHDEDLLASSAQQQPPSVFDYINIIDFYFIIVNDYIIIVIV